MTDDIRDDNSAPPDPVREQFNREFAELLRNHGHEDAASQLLATGKAGNGGWRQDPAVLEAMQAKLDAVNDEKCRVEAELVETRRRGDEARKLLPALNEALKKAELERLEAERGLARARANHAVAAAAVAMLEAVTIQVNLVAAELDALLGEKSGHREKRDVVEHLSRLIRRWGLYVEHPEKRTPCNLLCVYDIWGGKFVLAERKTDKRSKTTRRLSDMLPFSLMWPED